MKNNNTFIKAGKLIINVNAISAIFPHDIRGYVILIHGHEFRVSEDEGRVIIDRILDNDTTTSTFDPDKRISPDASTSAGLTPTKINKLRIIVNEFNKTHSYAQFSMNVNGDGSIKISRDNVLGAVLTISQNGIIVEDTVSNSHNGFKNDIIDVLNS